MSFRELRNFTEVLRSLGYHRLVSMENFRSPNFELVADILDWLLHRFDPGCSIPDDISTESQRLEFVKAACTRVWTRTGTKINPRKLYGADGYAVKELLRLAQLLNDAQRSVSDQSGKADVVEDNEFGLNARISDLKTTRTLCSDIVESGAELHDLLHRDGEARQDRERALRFLDGMSRNLDSTGESEALERSVSGLLASAGQNLEQLRSTSEELQQDERGLEQKLKKKRQELDRCRKRLVSLEHVRPAFMDEYEQLESELERYYEQYVGRFRNLDYLEFEIDKLNREEKERMEENDRALKRMQKRLREEEWRLLRGEDNEDTPEKRRVPQAKSWTPGGIVEDADDVSSAASCSESNLPISVGGSDDSDDDLRGGLGLRAEAPVSAGGSGSDDDILNESEDGGDISDDGGGYWGGGPPRQGGGAGSDCDF